MVVAAVEEKHQPIAEQFGSDCGAAFMQRDSEMAVQVMLRVLEETGRVPLPVHDSFLVPDLDQEGTGPRHAGRWKPPRRPFPLPEGVRWLQPWPRPPSFSTPEETPRSLHR